MKKLTLLMIMIASLTMTNEVYAEGNSGKDKPEREKPERDKPERDKPEKDKPERDKPEKKGNGNSGESSLQLVDKDAHYNWGQLKKKFEGEEGESALKTFFGISEEEELPEYDEKMIKEAIKAERVIRRELKIVEPSLDKEDIEKEINLYLYRDEDELPKVEETEAMKRAYYKYWEISSTPDAADETKTSEDSEEIEIEVEIKIEV